MILRWVAAGVVEAVKGFRRLKGMLTCRRCHRTRRWSESVAHSDDRLAGLIRLCNRTGRTVSTAALAFTIASAPTANTQAFRHVKRYR
jgi:hypothetical protein